MLAASLWESIEDPFKFSVDIDDEAALKLAEERNQEIESGQVTAISHEQLMHRLRQWELSITPRLNENLQKYEITTTNDPLVWVTILSTNLRGKFCALPPCRLAG